MRKIKVKKKEEYKDSGPDLYDRYFEKYKVNSKDLSFIPGWKGFGTNRALVMNTSFKDGIGSLISNEDRLDILIEDRIMKKLY